MAGSLVVLRTKDQARLEGHSFFFYFLTTISRSGSKRKRRREQLAERISVVFFRVSLEP